MNFNRSRYNAGESAVDITVHFPDVGFASTTPVKVRDLYAKRDVGTAAGSWTGVAVPRHGVRMLRVSLAN